VNNLWDDPSYDQIDFYSNQFAAIVPLRSQGFKGMCQAKQHKQQTACITAVDNTMLEFVA